MKRLLPAVALVCLLALPSIAGETTGPGKSDPPPCTENCTSAPNATASVLAELLVAVMTVWP